MADRLKNLNIFTVNDLLWHLPFRYEDYSLVSKIDSIQEGETVTVIGRVLEAKNVYTKYRKQIQSVSVTDGTGKISAIWFNQPFLIKNFMANDTIAISGKAERSGPELQFLSPNYEKVYPDMPLISTGKIIPIYPETNGVTSKWLRARMMYLLSLPVYEDYLPQEIRNKYRFPDLKTALLNLHFPVNLQDLAKFKNRLAFDELFLLELNTLLHKTHWQKQVIAAPLIVNKSAKDKFVQKLPFKLTSSQNKAVDEILSDLTKPYPMNRLLQGDVGSGKTVVAAIAMYTIFLNHGQSVFLVPTEILAEQHYETLKNIFRPFGLKIDLITSSHKSLFINHKSKIDVIVGTHALLEKKVQLNRTRLIVIDEQHRFGVEQRSIIREKGENPHILTMTATPIPRTIALTLYGNLDLSTIDEMPAGRKPVKTWVVPKQKRTSAYAWIRSQILETKSQAFIICPFIKPSETIKGVRAAVDEFKHLQKNIFPDLKLALIHGKIKAAEKQQILEMFKNGRYDILVATPVVEVGIDIPNATIMLIEAAERFGLAQLHQLRGRVGRSNKQSYCLLFCSDQINVNISRLQYMTKTDSGVRLAEYDLQSRGPGEVYGIKQHGRNFLKIASYSDVGLIQKARLEAQNLLNRSTVLNDFPLLKQRLESGKISQVSPD